MPANSLFRVVVVFWKDGRKKPYQAYSNLSKFFELNPTLPPYYKYRSIANKLLLEDGIIDTELLRLERLIVNKS